MGLRGLRRDEGSLWNEVSVGGVWAIGGWSVGNVVGLAWVHTEARVWTTYWGVYRVAW
jgi:hypothetical protein